MSVVYDLESPYDQAEMMYECFRMINKLRADNGFPSGKKIDNDLEMKLWELRFKDLEARTCYGRAAMHGIMCGCGIGIVIFICVIIGFILKNV